MGEKVFFSERLYRRRDISQSAFRLVISRLARCVLFSALERRAFNPHFLSRRATATKAFVGGFVVPRADFGAGRHNFAPRLSLSKHISIYTNNATRESVRLTISFTCVLFGFTTQIWHL